MNKKLLLFFTIAFAFCMAAFIPVKAQAANPGLSYSKLVLEKGQRYRLYVKDSEGKAAYARWYTSDVSTVQVWNGIVTGMKTGSATITAVSNGKAYTCKVMVGNTANLSIEQSGIIKTSLWCVGNRYRYGGTSLTNGADCSGFVMAIYQKLGYNLPHNAFAQMVSSTPLRSMGQMRPGDLVFYGSSRWSCNHVAIYIGDGKVVHASTERTGIVVSNYNYRKICGVGRVLKTATYAKRNTANTARAAAK